jgi:hypothetical protein
MGASPSGQPLSREASPGETSSGGATPEAASSGVAGSGEASSGAAGSGEVFSGAAGSGEVFSGAASSGAASPASSAGLSASSAGERGWPPEALALAQALQRSLTIDDRQWHRLKTQRPRRAAEQLAAALVQLLSADDPKCGVATPARREATALTEHALAWLRAEISDPGCPSHGR